MQRRRPQRNRAFEYHKGADRSRSRTADVHRQALPLTVIEYQTEAVLDLQRPHFGHLDAISGLRQWRDALVEYHCRL